MIAPLLVACANLPGWLRDISVLGLHVSISSFLDTFGYIAVFLFIGIESTGIPFPGETMLVAASVYAAQGCSLQEPFVILACILGATTGDNIGFWVGRTGGRGLISKYGKYVRLNESHLAGAERYFQKYGGATVFFGRFLAILRAWAAFLAGVNRMDPTRFFIYNLSGAVLWSTTFGLIGYGLGKNLGKLQQVITTLGTVGVIIVVLIVAIGVVALVASRRRRHPHQPGTGVAHTDLEPPMARATSAPTPNPSIPAPVGTPAAPSAASEETPRPPHPALAEPLSPAVPREARP